MPTLTKDSPVAQWAVELPQAAKVFEQLQIDYCCGGDIPLSEACGKKALSASDVVQRLQQAASDPTREPVQNWLAAPLTELCDHIQQTHHGYLREQLPRLEALIDKVVAAHGANHVELGELQSVFASLRAELEPHMMKEEQVLFPAIRQMERAANRPQLPFGTAANPIRMMEHEHDIAGNALAKMRELTNNYLVPDDACNSYRVMLEALNTLEQDLHQHIHKENNILFPRTLALEQSLPSAG